MIYRVYQYATDATGAITDCYRTPITLDATADVDLKKLFLRLKKLGVIGRTEKLKCHYFKWQGHVIGVAHFNRPLFELRLNSTVKAENHWYNWAP